MHQLSYHCLRESAHNSASHRCAQLLLCSPGLWRHRNTQVEVISFWRRASFCYGASTDSPLFATAKEISAPWQAEGVAVAEALVQNTQALVEEPCGPWAEQECSAQRGSTCREQVICSGLFVPPPETVITAGLRYLLQDPLLRPLCTRSTYATLH